jgi:U4/U6 small nuclear ribonucleoprotein PRP3
MKKSNQSSSTSNNNNNRNTNDNNNSQTSLLQLQQRIQEQMKSLQNNNNEQKKLSKNARVKLDEDGNLIDEDGNIIQLQAKPQATTLINKKQQEEKRAKLLNISKPPDIKKESFYDPSIKSSGRGQKRRRELNFNEPGKFNEKEKRIKIEKEKRRTQKEMLAQMDVELSEKEKELQQQSIKEANERRIREKLRAEKIATMIGSCHLYMGVTPFLPEDENGTNQRHDNDDLFNNIEWWDAAILPHSDYDKSMNENNVYSVTVPQRQISLIEYDVPIPPAHVKPEAGPLPLMLTAKERKKLRTQTRLERQREMQQKIKQGLIPPPPPKANLKNFMRVHLADGTQDPTKLERKIREEVEQRKQNHEKRNQEKKLTKEQKKQKKAEKLNQDEANELVTVVYKVRPLTHPQNKFKLNVNANDLKISGCVINATNEGLWMVIAEGGQKAITKFSNIIEKRVNWDLSATPSTNDEDDESEKWKLVWKGAQADRSFKVFRFQTFADVATARNYLNDHGIAYYLDYCL